MNIVSLIKKAGIKVSNEEAALNLLFEATQRDAIVRLVRQGRSMGVVFSSDPQSINGPQLRKILLEHGLSEDEVGEFFANIKISN